MRIAVPAAAALGGPADPTEPAPIALALGLPLAGLDLTGLDLAGLALPADATQAIANFLARSLASVEPSKLAAAGSIERLALATDAPQVVYLVGIGAATPPELRTAGALVGRAATTSPEWPQLTFVTPGLDLDASAALVEGLLLGSYRFQVGGPPASEPSVTLRGADPEGIERGQAAAAATLWARDLTNTRSSIKTPAWLAEQARRVLVPLGVTVLERDGDWLTENRFGGVLAVGGGSAAPPRLIEASWKPRGAPADLHVVLVGKSITYDSGGINIKPLDSMSSMYTDMSGGAAVLGALRMIAQLRVPIRVTGLLPAAENSVSGAAMRPGDVIRHFGGRTSEVANTDAEGRLVLADAMAYAAARLKPTVLIDVATLTGAMKVALGVRTGGLFASTDQLASELIEAGAATGEPLWRLPLAEEYRSGLKSDIADANNSPGNPGGITAALYLQAFSGGLPWAHLDIAGPSRATEDAGELSLGATGFGAHLLGAWLRSRATGRAAAA